MNINNYQPLVFICKGYFITKSKNHLFYIKSEMLQ